MLSGYRTYLTFAVIILNNVLKAMGFTDFASEEVTHAIDVILRLSVSSSAKGYQSKGCHNVHNRP